MPEKLHQRTPLVIGSREDVGFVADTLRRVAARSERSRFPAGVVKTVYGPEDWTGDPARDLGRPGEFPFTRGPYPNMYTGRLWTMRQYAGFGTAQETNQRFRQLLAAGQMGLSTAFDLPTQMGYDSDHPMAAGRGGPGRSRHRYGGGLEDALSGDPAGPGLHLDDDQRHCRHPAGHVCRGGRRAAGVRGASSPARSRTTCSRSTSRAARTSIRRRRRSGWWPTSSASSPDEGMSFNPISISGYHMREAGATRGAGGGVHARQCAGVCRRSRVSAGLPIDSFGPRLSFFFASHNDLFEEAAKFRAARRLWARVVRERFGAGDATARMRFHTQTGGVTLQAQQPLNNVVRVTVQALAAVLGGTQSLHTNGYDEALSLPTTESATLALRTQQILGFESGVAGVGGSAGRQLLRRGSHRCDRGRGPRPDAPRSTELGGAAQAIERGFFQEAIARSAYELQKAQESGERVVVGVNRYTDDSPPLSIQTPDFSALEGEQRARLAQVKRARTGGRSAAPCKKCSKPPAVRRLSCRPSSTRSGPAPPSARSAIPCARSGASTVLREGLMRMAWRWDGQLHSS